MKESTMQRYGRWLTLVGILGAIGLVRHGGVGTNGRSSEGEAGAAHHCGGTPGVGHQLFLDADPQWAA